MKQQNKVPELTSEPTIDSILSDPIVRAVMAADGVDQAELRELLRSIAERLQARDSDG